MQTATRRPAHNQAGYGKTMEGWNGRKKMAMRFFGKTRMRGKLVCGLLAVALAVVCSAFLVKEGWGGEEVSSTGQSAARDTLREEQDNDGCNLSAEELEKRIRKIAEGLKPGSGNKDLSVVRGVLEEAAENKNDPEVEFHLAFMHYDGIGVPVDKNKAVEWLRKAAKRGNAHSQYNLAAILSKMQKGDEHYQEIMFNLQKAVDAGHVMAMFALGEEYDMPEQGRARRGMERDERKAEYYYNLAAQRGYTKAKRNLAVLRLKGADAKKHSADATKSLQECADNGDHSCRLQLAFIYFGVYEKSDISVDSKLAMRNLHILVEQGYPNALSFLGDMYIHGFFVPEDRNQGMKFLQLAAEQGYEPAILRIKELKND
jgi:TPR repeat protein